MKSKLLFTLLLIFSLSITVFAQDTIISPHDTITIPQDTVIIDDEEKDYVYMDIKLFDEEKEKVEHLISQISPDEIEEFKNKYNLWLQSSRAPELQMYSNPDMYKTEEFYDFKNYTLGLGFEYIGLLIDFYQDNHTGILHFILLDVTFEDYGYLLDEVRTEIRTPQFTEDGKKIYYSHNYSFANLYFKKILSLFEFNGNNLVVTSADGQPRRMKPDILTIFPNPVSTNLKIQFRLSKSDLVTLKIIDLVGNEIEVIDNNKFYSEGQHTISLTRSGIIKDGIYILVFETQNSKSIKKFIVN